MPTSHLVQISEKYQFLEEILAAFRDIGFELLQESPQLFTHMLSQPPDQDHVRIEAYLCVSSQLLDV